MLENSRSRSVLWFGIAVNLFFIGYYKYYNFFLDISNTAFRTDFHLKKIHLPIGISFFTFQAVSYLIDVYRNDVSAQRKFSGFLLYISFFPQLIAGPIVRYIDIQKNLFFRTVNWEDLDVGLKRFVIGLSKKVLIANQMALASDRIFAVPIDEMNTALAWLGIVSYSFQIYYDFSGYSDMAIGLGRVFGFHFNENFNSPYAASSVQDFWRRWHISLSTWFRDYLYIPLGGNRVSQKRLIINLLIVFFLTGLWHGASFNFIIWGLIHGFFLIIERYFPKERLNKAPYILKNAYALLVVMTAWVFFRVEGLENALRTVQILFSFQMQKTIQSPELYMDSFYLSALSAGIFFSYYGESFLSVRRDWHFQSFSNTVGYAFYSLLILLLLFFSVMVLTENSYNPFIYFRF